MKKILIAVSLLNFMNMDAVEGKYFSLKQRADSWLHNEQTQKALKDDASRKEIIALLERAIEYKATSCQYTFDGEEAVGIVIENMFEVVENNSSWKQIRSFGIEDQAYELYVALQAMDEQQKDLSPELQAKGESLEHSVASRYRSPEEYVAARDQLEEAGIVEGCTYLLDLINKN